MSDAVRLAVSLGDPAGIGPEVVLKALAAGELPGEVTLVGDARCVAEAARRLGLPVPPRLHAPEAVACDPACLFAGRPSAASGRAAAGAIRAAVALVRAGAADALVTAPINKEALGLAGEPFPGHTELLASELQAPRVRMMLMGGPLKVVLATTHLALRDVPAALSVDGVLETLEVAAEGLRAFGLARPRLALAALNPHASDGGRFGDEEARLLAPAIQRAQAAGLLVTGPHPADTLFARVARAGTQIPGTQSGVDAVVALYHDQGLIPVKLAAFGAATNVTLGLPIVRTSPDHGTAYDIAGAGVAEADSFREALRVAAGLVRARAAPALSDRAQ